MEACASIADKSGKRPVYAATRIDIEDGVATFSATNGNESIRVQLAAGLDPGSEGSVFLPSENLLRAIKDAKKCEFAIKWNGKTQRATIDYAGARLRLPTEPPGNLPPIHGFSESRPSIKLQASALTGLFKRTVCAVQTDFTNRSLHGVCMRVKGTKLVMAATDGKKFSLVSYEIENPREAALDVLVPPPNPKQVATLFSLPEEWMEVQSTVSKFTLRGPLGDMSWRTIAGTFPDYEGHIPLTSARELTVDRLALIEVLERHTVIQTSGGMKHKVTFREGEMEVHSESSVDGGLTATLGVPWTWEDMVIFLDPILACEGLKAMSSKDVLVGIDSPDQPLSFKEPDGDFNFRYMVVPMSER